MRFCDVADRAGPDQLAEAAITIFAMALISHLGGCFGGLSHFAQLSRLENVVCQRLFAVNGFAELNSYARGRRMMMVWRGNKNSINLLADFVVHHAIIGEEFRPGWVVVVFRQVRFNFRMLFLIRVNNSDEVVFALRDQPFDVLSAAAAATDLDAIQLPARTVGGEDIWP